MKPNSSRLGLVGAMALLLTISGCGRLAGLRRSLERESGEAKAKEAPVSKATIAPRPAPTLQEIATSDAQWTGVAVSRDGILFVCYPRWSEDPEVSVGEIRIGGQIHPCPDQEWNSWAPTQDPARHFICAQSVYVDRNDFLWVLDPANAYLRGVVAGGAKLVKIDFYHGSVVQEIAFDDTIAPATSYLNDVRVDSERNVAYITDSGLGAIIVVDLTTGKARRLLANHSSTKSENIVLKINGKEWLINGQAPQVHVDGLALDPKGDYLYYHALTARNLYRIQTQYLRDPALSERELAAKVESLGVTCASDGIEFGPDGYLYLTGIEDGTIKVFASIGETETVIKDPRLIWPDSFALCRDGYMHVTTSQINLDQAERGPYKLFRFMLGK